MAELVVFLARVFQHGGIITAGAEVGLAEAVAILVECGAVRDVGPIGQQVFLWQQCTLCI